MGNMPAFMTSEQMFEKLKTIAKDNEVKMSKQQLALKLGYSSASASGFNTNLKNLINKELVSIDSDSNLYPGKQYGSRGKILKLKLNFNSLIIKEEDKLICIEKKSLNERLEYLYNEILNLSNNNILKISKQKLFEQTKYTVFFDFSNDFSALCKTRKVKILHRGESRTDISTFEVIPENKNILKQNENIKNKIEPKEIITNENINEKNNIEISNIKPSINTENKLLEIDNLFLDFTNKYTTLKQQLLEKDKQLLEQNKMILELQSKISTTEKVEMYKETITDLKIEMEQLRALNRKWMQQALQYKEMLYQR